MITAVSSRRHHHGGVPAPSGRRPEPTPSAARTCARNSRNWHPGGTGQGWSRFHPSFTPSRARHAPRQHHSRNRLKHPTHAPHQRRGRNHLKSPPSVRHTSSSPGPLRHPSYAGNSHGPPTVRRTNIAAPSTPKRRHHRPHVTRTYHPSTPATPRHHSGLVSPAPLTHHSTPGTRDSDGSSELNSLSSSPSPAPVFPSVSRGEISMEARCPIRRRRAASL